MSIEEHPEYQEEVARLTYTKDYIKKVLSATEEYRNKYKADIKEAMKELDFLDSSQSYIRILINSNLIDQVNENHDSLVKVKDKPYFARVDFKKEGALEPEQLYIGKTSLYEVEKEKPLIVDWRAPIASIYYEERLGEITYQTEVEKKKGELLLKRQITIEDGEITDLFDIDITTNDTFLQASLDVNADHKLKDIAATIQKEQNEVIRAEIEKPLIVQGVAGSGKTTIALHRIAYLIYTYEDNFDPDNFMIITPNKLFIDYISDVLPELGVENVKQTTFIDFMEELMIIEYQLIDSEQKLSKLITSNQLSSNQKELISWASSFKGSIQFRDIIDSYLEDIAQSYLPRTDFKLGNYILFSYGDLNDIFLKQLKHLPLEKRISRIENIITNKLQREKKKILEKVKADYEQKISHFYYSLDEDELEEKRPFLISLMKERDTELKQIKENSQDLVKDYLNSFNNLALIEHYHKILKPSVITRHSKTDIAPNKLKFLAQYSQEILEQKKFELEDYAALAYLKYKIWGLEQKIKVNNVVMDEAQDYSPFQFYILKEILNTSMFTILGDIAQGIHAYRGISDWNKIIEDVFTEEKTSYRTLVQSYRTTIEVMNFANQIIKELDNSNLVLAKPVIRRGQKPEVRSYKQKSKLVKDLSSKIEQLKQENYKSIALICKTSTECEQLKKELAQSTNFELNMISNKNDNYEAGVVIVPSYLTKGLEFDVVVIVNLEEKYEENEIDLKLLYVAMTRSLHRLYIYQQNQSISVLTKIDEDFYQHINN